MRLDLAMPTQKEKHSFEVTNSKMPEDFIKSMILCFEKGSSINSKDISCMIRLSPSDQ